MNVMNPGRVIGAFWHRVSLLLLLSALAVACGEEGGQAQSADPPAADNAQADPQDVFDLSQIGVNEGSLMTAAIGIVDFSDFGCIYCANFHNDDYPELHEEFVASGEVLWKYVPISIGGFPNGDMAGVTGICADEVGRSVGFADMRDHLFVQRDEWMAASPNEARDLFISYAGTVGLSLDAFTVCFEGDSAAERLARNNQVAREVGVTATPTFIVQGTPVRGAPPLTDFQNALRELIAQSRGQSLPRTPADNADPGAPGA